MPPKKRAQLVSDLVEGRRAKRAAPLRLVATERRDPAAKAPPMAPAATLVPVAVIDPPPTAEAKRGPKRRGNLSAVSIAGHKQAAVSSESAFHAKGTATAATFRPWYWQY
jgi:hypothetical protein